MYKIAFKPSFIRQYKKLKPELKNEVSAAIERLKKDPKDPRIKNHKLKGRLDGYSSISVNYRDRIVFKYEKPKTFVLYGVGDHDIYR